MEGNRERKENKKRKGNHILNKKPSCHQVGLLAVAPGSPLLLIQ